MTDLNNPYS